MKNADVFIVRMIPFLLYIVLGINICRSWNGEDMTGSYLLHSNSVLYSSAFFIISLCNKRYHCVYNRLMYLVLFVTPLFNYLDYKLHIVKSIYIYGVVYTLIYIFVLLVTAYLAIDHFNKVLKRRKKHAKSY